MSVKYSNRDDNKRNMMVKYLNKAIDDIKMSRKVEKGIYNYVIKVSKEKI